MNLLMLSNTNESVSSPAVVCLGFFDGVHLGHQAIINEGKRIGQEKSLLLCVHTYDIPPESVIRQRPPVQLLTSGEEKARLFEQMGVDVVAISHFDDELMKMSGRQFVKQVLIGQLKARHIVAGYNHRFGYRGDTDSKALRALCDELGIGLTIVPAVRIASGQAVSSSAIRTAIGANDLALAEEMLGRPIAEYQGT